MIETDRPLTVGEVARSAGLTIRTLHHYDEIGLVQPGNRSSAGYRLYGQPELERLQEVLFFRELGFPLEKIREIVSNPEYDRGSALRRHRELLSARVERLMELIDAVDLALEARRTGMTLSKEDMLEAFDGFDPSDYEAEAEAKWGKTDAYAESARRTGRYTKADWQRLKAEADDINAEFLDLMADGIAPDADEAMQVAERHRAYISGAFYECSPEMHAGLGQMYVADPRFTANIDKTGEGLAAYMSEAIAANSARAAAQ
jgi:DNA-binding transcriptional MerR regulator